MMPKEASAKQPFSSEKSLVPEKLRFTVSLPEHVATEITKHAGPLSSNPSEYIALIARKWFADGCPPVTAEEAKLRERTNARRAS